MKRNVLVLSSAAVLLLASCTDGDVATGNRSQPSAETGSTIPEEPDIRSFVPTRENSRVGDFEYAGSVIEFWVGPVVLEENDATLSVVEHVKSGPTQRSYDPLDGSVDSNGGGTRYPVRLIDPETLTVYEATDLAELKTPTVENGDDDTVFHSKFDKGGLEGGSPIDVYLPGLGYVADVEVVTRESEGLDDVSDIPFTGKGTFDGSLVAPIEAHVEAIDDSSDTLVVDGSIETNLASDVLFDVDSSDLRPGSESVLSAVGEQLASYKGGSLRIVGHTDDVADDQYNQTLSEARARSVETALNQTADLSRFDLTVEGVGETDPRVEGTDSESRRLNRRVEIFVEPSGEMEPSAVMGVAGGQMPPAVGVSGIGANGVDVSYPDGSVVHMQMPEVRRRGGLLVGTLTMTARTGNPYTGPLLGLMGNSPYMMTAWSPTGLSLLVGGNRVLPGVYTMPGDPDSHFAEAGWPVQLLTDKLLFSQLDAGQALPTTFIWPDTGQDTVTVSYEPERLPGQNMPFRLTDIPVVEGDAR